MVERTQYTLIEARYEINSITDIVVTEIEADPEGGFVREFRFSGSYGDNGPTGVPRSLTLRVKGATRDDIFVQTPELTF